MASKSVIINGVTYSSVPSVQIPLSSGSGNATFTDTSDATASAADILSGETAYVDGAIVTGTISSKAAATYQPSTSAQSIASGQYLAGAQTISAVTTSNLSASNILSGVTVKVGCSADDDCVASVTGTLSLPSISQDSSTKVLTIS